MSGSTGTGEQIAPAPKVGAGRVIAVVVAVLALVVVSVMGYRWAAAKRVASSELARAITMIEQADRLVVKVDEAVSAQVESGLETRALEATDLTDDATAQLQAAIDLLDEVGPELSDAENVRARLLREAAVARVEMLSEAPAILAVSSRAAQALPKAETAWARVLKADTLSDRAVSEYNKLTKSGVEASARLNKQVQSELGLARNEFLAAEAAFPESGLEVYVGYVDARIALNGLSRRSDTAWLAGDLTQANDLIATYNAQDKKTTEQAKALPASPASVVSSGYESATKTAAQRYDSARERATKADAELQGI